MKKLFSIALALVLTCSLAACGCQAQDTMPATTAPTTVPVTTAPTSAPTTAPTTAPPMDPSMETNIPYPSVDTSTPDMTEGTTGQASENGQGGSENGQEGSQNSQSGNEGRMRMR